MTSYKYAKKHISGHGRHCTSEGQGKVNYPFGPSVVIGLTSESTVCWLYYLFLH